MLPLLHRQQYEEFKQKVEQLRASEATVLKSDVAELQQLFQHQILSLGTDELTPADAHRVHSFHVEFDKQLRLLSMDVMFLQASRQTATGDQRRSQIRDRLDILIRYCEALFEK